MTQHRPTPHNHREASLAYRTLLAGHPLPNPGVGLGESELKRRLRGLGSPHVTRRCESFLQARPQRGVPTPGLSLLSVPRRATKAMSTKHHCSPCSGMCRAPCGPRRGLLSFTPSHVTLDPPRLRPALFSVPRQQPVAPARGLTPDSIHPTAAFPVPGAWMLMGGAWRSSQTWGLFSRTLGDVGRGLSTWSLPGAHLLPGAALPANLHLRGAAGPSSPAGCPEEASRSGPFLDVKSK